MRIQSLLCVCLLILLVVGCGQTQAAVNEETPSPSLPTTTQPTLTIQAVDPSPAVRSRTFINVHRGEQSDDNLVATSLPTIQHTNQDKTQQATSVPTQADNITPAVALDATHVVTNVSIVSSAVQPEPFLASREDETVGHIDITGTETDTSEISGDVPPPPPAPTQSAITAVPKSEPIESAAPEVSSYPTPAPPDEQPTPDVGDVAGESTPSTIPPTDVPAPAVASVASVPSEPVRIVIESIAMDQNIVSVGLDENRMPIVPDHDVAWYNLSAQPGQGDNIVMWGHVLRFQNAPNIAAPFARVKELTPGSSITLYTSNGGVYKYTVQDTVLVTPDQIEYILPQGSERLTLVSCIGEYIIIDGSVENMTHRLIVIAVPTS